MRRQRGLRLWIRAHRFDLLCGGIALAGGLWLVAMATGVSVWTFQ